MQEQAITILESGKTLTSETMTEDTQFLKGSLVPTAYTSSYLFLMRRMILLDSR
jgi:hypothetical protein